MKVEVSSAALLDLSQIYRHHYAGLRDLGESQTAATESARQRVQSLAAAAMALVNAPKSGELRHEFGAGIRVVTQDRAELWFRVAGKAVTVLAILSVAPGLRRTAMVAALSSAALSSAVLSSAVLSSAAQSSAA